MSVCAADYNECKNELAGIENDYGKCFLICGDGSFVVCRIAC